MSFNKTRARHRAETTGVWSTISKTTAGRGRTIGSTAAVVAAGSGLMLGMAAPASAGVVGDDNYTPVTQAAPAAAVAAPAAEAPVAAPVPEAFAAPAASTHTVQSGDTLGQIAATYGVGLDSVLALNGLSLASIIYPGDVITVSGEAAAPAAAAPAAVDYAPASYATESYAAPAAAANTGVISTQATSVTPAPAPTATVGGANATMLASAYAQLAAYGTQVSTPEPGDMIYYADGGMGLAHIAIYIGNGEAIHSGWNGNQTVINSANVGSGPVYYRVA